MIFLDSFEAKGVFSQLSGLSLAASPRILFLCRFPSMVNTVRFSRNLFVVGEDEYRNHLCCRYWKSPNRYHYLWNTESIAR